MPLAVKRSGLQGFRDFTVVFEQVGDTYEVRMLELGRQDETWVEVLGGLKPGAQYVDREQLPDQGRHREIRRKPRSLRSRSHARTHPRSVASTSAFAVLLAAALALALLGIWSFQHLPIDAVPDITNVQVQINTEAPGYTPLEAEQRITLAAGDRDGGPGAAWTTRARCRAMGCRRSRSCFTDGTDLYFARQQVAERLQSVAQQLAARTSSRRWGRPQPVSARSSCTPSMRKRRANGDGSRSRRPICASRRTGSCVRNCCACRAWRTSTPSAATRSSTSCSPIPRNCWLMA